jgi:hypothetical protein
MHISFGSGETIRPSRLTLYLASRDRDGAQIPDYIHWVERARRLFARLFGGSTAIPDAWGLWYCKEQGTFIEEQTAIITSYVSRDDVITHLDTLRTFLEEILFATRQEAVAVDLDGDLHFIYASHRSVCAQPPTTR